MSYFNQEFSKLLKKHGAFFAFSNSQFEEKQESGVKYARLFSGLICPSDTAKELLDEMQSLSAFAVEKDLKENGKAAIIERELYNHECFYTGRIDDCVRALEAYPITREEVKIQYRKILERDED